MDEKTVKHIAKLSSFDFNESELKEYANDLTNICVILDNVKNYDTKGVDPMISPVTKKIKFREDVCLKQDNRIDFNKFACEIRDDYFIVPQVVK